MKIHTMKKLLLILSLIGFSNLMTAQRIYYPVNTASPLIVNAAATGNFRNDGLRICVSAYQSYLEDYLKNMTWNSSSFLTIDKYFSGLNLGLGNAFGFEQQYIYYYIKDYLSGAYSFKLKNSYYMNVGVQAGFIMPRINENTPYFIVLDENDPLLHELGKYMAKVVPDFNAGILLHKKNNEALINPWLGFNVQHLTKPKTMKNNSTARFPRYFHIDFGAEMKITEKLANISEFNYQSYDKFSDGFINVTELAKFHCKRFDVYVGPRAYVSIYHELTIHDVGIVGGMECKHFGIHLETGTKSRGTSVNADWDYGISLTGKF